MNDLVECNPMINWTKGAPVSNWALRVIDESRKTVDSKFDRVPENYLLGSAYAVLYKGDTGEFQEKMDEDYSEYDSSSVRGIVCGGNGLEIFLMENTSKRQFSYFIMGETGKTFEKL